MSIFQRVLDDTSPGFRAFAIVALLMLALVAVALS